MRFQLAVSPFTKPDIMTNVSTTRLIPVKILLTSADSLTPNANNPVAWEVRVSKFTPLWSLAWQRWKEIVSSSPITNGYIGKMDHLKRFNCFSIAGVVEPTKPRCWIRGRVNNSGTKIYQLNEIMGNLDFRNTLCQLRSNYNNILQLSDS